MIAGLPHRPRLRIHSEALWHVMHQRGRCFDALPLVCRPYLQRLPLFGT